MSESGKAAKIQAMRRVDVFGLIMKWIWDSENCIARPPIARKLLLAERSWKPGFGGVDGGKGGCN